MTDKEFKEVLEEINASTKTNDTSIMAALLLIARMLHDINKTLEETK